MESRWGLLWVSVLGFLAHVQGKSRLGPEGERPWVLSGSFSKLLPELLLLKNREKLPDAIRGYGTGGF